LFVLLRSVIIRSKLFARIRKTEGGATNKIIAGEMIKETVRKILSKQNNFDSKKVARVLK
jgi:hypothetical protein